MVEIKTAISFDEYTAIVDKVVNDCFPDGTYSPANYDLSLRTALLCAFAPDYDLSGCDDNNALWERVTSKEAIDIVNKIYDKENPIGYIAYTIEDRIKDSIDYRIKLLTSGSMSMTDIALSTLVDTLTKKVESVDTSMFTKENIEAVFNAIVSTKDGDFAKSFVNALVDNNIISKPNRETRRKNIKQTKKTESAEK